MEDRQGIHSWSEKRPCEFAEVERESRTVTSLSDALKLVAEALHEDKSILPQAEDQTKYAVNTILESARKTLEDLESFVDQYWSSKRTQAMDLWWNAV